MTSRVCIHSFDQDATSIEKTRRLTDLTGTTAAVRFIHAPLRSQVIEDTPTTCYTFDPVEWTDKPDFVVIDGPAAEAGARFGTLPFAHSIAKSGARFYLDDALRDGELDTARRWSRLAYVRIEGLMPTEKGMLVGTIV